MVFHQLTKLRARLTDNLKRNKAARKRIWQNFCEETPLQGFLFFHNTHFRWEKVIWLLLVVLAIGVTFNDSIRTIHDYMQEELLSKVTLEQNETITLPNPTFCFLYSLQNPVYYYNISSAKLTSEFLRLHNEQILFYFKSDPQLQQTTSIGHLSKDAPILVPFLYIFSKMMSLISRVEYNYLQNATTTDFKFDVYVKSFKAESDNLTVPASYAVFNLFEYHSPNTSVGYLYEYLIRNKLSLTRVSKLAAMYTCLYTDLLINGGETSNDVFCNYQYVNNVGGERFCIRPPETLQMIKFSAPTDEFKLAAPHISVGFLGFNFLVTTIILNFNRPTVSYSRDSYRTLDNSIVIQMASSVTDVDISITSYKLYNTAKTPCTDDVYWADCKTKCEAENFFKICGCASVEHVVSFKPETDFAQMCFDPVIFASNQSVPLLTSSKCLGAGSNISNSNYYICHAKCLKVRPCNHYDLNFHVANQNEFERLSLPYFSLKFPRLTYTEIEQVLAMDDQTFVSNLGGNLGLYIGGTFLAIIHLATSLLHLIVSLVTAKDSGQSELHNETIQLVAVPVSQEQIRLIAEKISKLEEENANLKADLKLLQKINP